jgi:hypothetical protein
MSAPSNSEPCNCFFLHEAATNPESPIVFDDRLNEFHVQMRNGYSMIYYCPICGGKAPTSLRDDLFAVISPEEEAKLTKITQECLCEQDMRRTLGEPDKTRISYVYNNFSESAYRRSRGKRRVERNGFQQEAGQSSLAFRPGLETERVKIILIILTAVLGALWWLDSKNSRGDSEGKGVVALEQHATAAPAVMEDSPESAAEVEHTTVAVPPQRDVPLADLWQVAGMIIAVEDGGVVVDCAPLELFYLVSAGPSGGAADSAALAKATIQEQKNLNDKENGPLQMVEAGKLVKSPLQLERQTENEVFLAGLPKVENLQVGDRLRVVAANANTQYKGRDVATVDMAASVKPGKPWLFDKERKNGLDR